MPDEGLLTDYEDWMPDFMEGLAKEIEKSRGLVQKAVNDAASDMVITPQVGSMTGSEGYGISGENTASLVKDTSASGIWTVSFMLKEF